MRRCPYCRRVIEDRLFLAHRQSHWDRARERKGTTGEWRTIRAFILRRDRYRCRTCGAVGKQKGGTADLEVHHLNGNWKDNRPQNLLTLCHDHHPR